jgi:hypothetical protein
VGFRLHICLFTSFIFRVEIDVVNLVHNVKIIFPTSSTHMKNCLLFLFVFSISAVSNAANWYVDDATVTDANDTYTSGVVIGTAGGTGTVGSPFLRLATAIAAASAGDFIYVDAGTYSTDFSLTFTITNLTIIGAGKTKTIFDRSAAINTTDYFMYIKASGATIKDLCIQYYDNNGTQTPGRSAAAITIGGTGSLITGILIDNVALQNNGNNTGNPAISVQSRATVVINNGGNYCNVSGSTSSGGIESYGTSINLTISNYVLSYNSKTTSNGSGLLINGDATNVVLIKNSTISNNNSTYGGGIAQYGGNLTMRDCIIDGNTVASATNKYGGGFYISCGVAKLSRCIIQNNGGTTVRGSGIACRYTGAGAFSSPGTISLTVDSCTFQNNSTSATGADIYAANGSGNACNVTVTDCRFFTAQAAGRYNICSDGTSPATTINTTYFGTAPSTVGATVSSSITPVLSVRTAYTAAPSVSAFSGSCGSILLPVELLSFTAEKQKNNSVNVNWSTLTEKNNDYFIIKKSIDGIEWNEIAREKGAGLSYSQLDYSIIDASEMAEVVYYELTQVDFDGKRVSFDPVAVQFKNESGSFYYVNMMGQIVDLKRCPTGIYLKVYENGETVKIIL